jgi:hypothetical protein
MNTFVYDPLPDFDILESIVQNDRTAASMQSSKNDTRNILHRIRRKLLGYELVVSLKQHERLESTPPLPSGMHVLLDRAPSSSIINKVYYTFTTNYYPSKYFKNLSGPGSVISETSEMTPSEQA